MTARPTIRYLEVPPATPVQETLAFEMQPIVWLGSGAVHAYELLYRGPRPVDWCDVDSAVMEFLTCPRAGLNPLFINLSNQTLISHDVDVFVRVASANDVTFELSEAMAGHAERASIAEKVNRMISAGARVALDDFGAGRDGLERLYSLQGPSVVKVDRDFILTCMQREDACRVLKMLVAEWRRAGVKSLAEGIENASMFEFAQTIDVDLVQGWWVDAMVAGEIDPE